MGVTFQGSIVKNLVLVNFHFYVFIWFLSKLFFCLMNCCIGLMG